METYHAAIVGLTGIGAARPAAHPLTAAPRSHAAAYHHHPRTELVAVCDKNPAALEQFRSTWHDVWPGLAYYEDYQAMLEETGPDLLSIATSDHAHADIAVAGAFGTPRAILCEKPIATTLADADRMITACHERNTLLSVEHTRRWDPTFLRARQLIHSGELGPLRTIVAEMFSQRAMLMRNAIHLIDLFTFFAEASPQWVVGELEEGFETHGSYSGDGGRDPNQDPFASAYIRYTKGIRVFLNSYKTTMPGWQMQLTCDEGRLELSDRSARLIRPRSHLDWPASDLDVAPCLFTHQLGAVNELVEVIEEGGELVSSGEEARNALELTLAIMQSHVRGSQPVTLPLPDSA
jgi:predicted dehydrogenase